MNDFEYYILRWKDANIYPAVEGDNVNLAYLKRSKKVDEPVLVKLTFGKPVPSNPVMADYHPVMPVFSPKVAKVLASFNLEYIQILPAVIRGKKDELFNYFFVNICNEISCLNFEKSDCEVNSIGAARNLKAIVLDYEKLGAKTLKERLIFILEESPNIIMFHKSIVDDIMVTNPIGIRFIKVQDYYKGIEFDN